MAKGNGHAAGADEDPQIRGPPIFLAAQVGEGRPKERGRRLTF
jgi:hypothetical protein